MANSCARSPSSTQDGGVVKTLHVMLMRAVLLRGRASAGNGRGSVSHEALAPGRRNTTHLMITSAALPPVPSVVAFSTLPEQTVTARLEAAASVVLMAACRPDKSTGGDAEPAVVVKKEPAGHADTESSDLV